MNARPSLILSITAVAITLVMTACTSQRHHSAGTEQPPGQAMTMEEFTELRAAIENKEPGGVLVPVTRHLAEQVESGAGHYVIRYEFEDNTLDDVPVNVPTTLTVNVLDAEGQPVDADHELTVDAAMPHHRHGLVRRPAVTALGNAAFRVEGVLFHMPGRWELYFDVTNRGITERSQVELNLE